MTIILRAFGVAFMVTLLALNLVLAATVKATWTASSSAPTADGVSYAASNLGDGKASTAWFEGADGSGLNEWVQADLGGERSVSGFTVWAGWWFTADQWKHYYRPKVLAVEFSDGSTQDFTLTDSYTPQVFELPAAKKSSTVKFRVKSGFSSDAFPDMAISEIQIRDINKPPGAPVRSASASSVFPADVDGNYEPKNLHDGILDTVWCEGNTAGDGTGEWLAFNLDGTHTVSSVQLRNGNAYSFGVYMKSNRATSATLMFGDGSKETITLKDSPAEQEVSFAPRTTNSVRMTFDTVKKGSEYNDMCVSELYWK